MTSSYMPCEYRKEKRPNMHLHNKQNETNATGMEPQNRPDVNMRKKKTIKAKHLFSQCPY